MGEQKSSSSRLGGLGLRNTSIGSGEIVEVQGGHIVRSTGRKDRHSKVCTAKGPRDRRVRLAAHTAIQFYDVQDRLGYDRPSKAVDWLINKAKSAIDELAELPAWNPVPTCSAPPNFGQFQQQTGDRHDEDNQQRHDDDELMIVTEQQSLHHDGGNQNQQDSNFLPPSLDSDAIADTIKSFFPMGASAEASSSTMQYPTFSTPDWLSRNSGQNHNQDLRLSLQSFQDPMMLHHHNQSHHTEQPHAQANHILLSGTPLGFDSGWQEHQQQQAVELGRLQRLAGWNAGGGDNASGSGGGGGYLFNSPPPQQQLHNQFFSQRGPLQSSTTPSVRAWMDPAALAIANAMADHASQQQQQQNPQMLPIYPSGIGYSSGFGGFSGFHIPARIQGDEEEHDGYSDKPSSASSDSRH